jgi:diacylglycerol kinase family enzyme
MKLNNTTFENPSRSGVLGNRHCGIPVRSAEVDSRTASGQHGHPVSHLQNSLRASPALVFVNPRAGCGRTQKYLLPARQIFEAERIPVEFVLTESAEDLDSRAKSAIAGGCRVLLAMGGDGTLQGLLNAACGSDLLLGILPTGGGNDFAAALSLPPEPLAAMRAVLRGQPRLVDLLRARTSDGRQRYCAGGGGVGLDVDALHYAGTAYRGLPGRSRYVVSAVSAWLQFTPLQVRAEFPQGGQPAMEAHVLLAGVLNAPTYGAGLRVAPSAQIDDGWLDLSFVKNLTAFDVLRLVPRLLATGNLPESYLTQRKTRKVLLRTDRPCLFQADGEILGPAPVEVEIVPAAAKVLAPPVVTS